VRSSLTPLTHADREPTATNQVAALSSSLTYPLLGLVMAEQKCEIANFTLEELQKEVRPFFVDRP
jgi:hypothetical protein